MTSLQLEDARAVTLPAAGPASWSKRSVDIVVGVPLCLVAIPVVMILCLVILVRHRANPLFVHKRIGYGGETVTIPKLRTLPTGTHPYADKTTTELPVLSGLARFLRRSHLDELPQLFLVPFGRLSLVGPRPRMWQEARECGDPEFDVRRICVPQGCTGLWQISGCSRRVSDDREFDLFYVEQRTLRLDLWILWRTVVQQLGARPVGLEDVPRWTLRDPSLSFETIG